MRILHVIDSLAIGGAERMLVDIANASAADGHQVGVCITRSSRNDLAKELRPDVGLHVLKRTKRFDLAALHTFSHFVQERDFQIIHVHGRSSFSFCAAAAMLHPTRIPLILHDHHGIEIDQRIPLWFRLWGRRYLAKYIGVYEKLRTWAITSGVCPEDIAVIGNGIDLARLEAAPTSDIRRQLGILDETLMGIVVAGLRPEKGIDLLIESLSRCAGLNIKILIAGSIQDDGYIQQCKAWAEEKGVVNQLIFLGERKDVASLNRVVDFALVPSRSESGPLVLIEYLASGLPVVAFRVGDIAQAASEHGIPGLVAPNDTAAFAEALNALVQSSLSERQARGRLGRTIAQQHFSIQSKMPSFYEVYRQALQKQ